MAESTIPKTKNLSRDTLPSDSSAIREDTKQTVSAAYQDKPGYMGHGIVKMETDTCRLDVQENIQTGSLKDAVIDIKEEVRDLDSEFPEQFEDISREKCYSSREIAIAEVREDTDKEVDFHGQLELFNRDQSNSDQEIMTYTQGNNIENSSALSGKENPPNIKNRSYEHKMYGIKVKEEFMENDAELQNCFHVNNTEERFPPLESILKNLKRNVNNSIELVKITNIITCDSAQTFNNNLVKKEEPEDDVDGSTENETSLPIEFSQTIEKKVSEEKSNAVVKDEKIEIDRNLPDDCIHLLNQVDAKDITDEKTQKLHKCNVCNKSFRSRENDEKITITDVKGAVTDNKTDLELVKITNIKTCDSAQTFNNTLVKKEEPEDDVEFSKHFETFYCEESGSVDKIIIANVKRGFAENETNLHRELRDQTVEKTVSEKKSNCVIVKDEIIEIDRNLPDNSAYVLNQVSAKDITEEKTQKLHKCNVCNKRFRSKEKFIGHMKRKIHQKREMKCEICNKVFYSNRKLNLHMNVHTKEKEFKCDVCDEIYFLKSLLITHMQSHLNEELRSCKFCGKLFCTPQKLKIHLNLHTKEKKFKCDVCYKVYFLKSALKSHMQSHLNEEQRSCKICGKLFSTPNNLKIHINTHTKEKKFKCDVCDKVYFLKAALISHMQSHSIEEQRTCKICRKLFTTKQSLKRHLNLHTQRK